MDYSFNTDYVLWHDERRTYLIQRYENNDSHRGWISVIHPAQAAMLSFFSLQQPFEDALNNLADFLNTTTKEAYSVIKPFIKNPDSFMIEHDDEVRFIFPKNILLETNANCMTTARRYKPDDFTVKGELDFKTKRYFTSPLNVTLMPSNNCVTNCIYCYADRNTKSKTMSFEQIRNIILEAKELDVFRFGMVGGEIFAFPQWYELICCIKENGFIVDRLSTKMPLTREDVKKLKHAGIRQMQISLDTLVPKTLCKILRVNEAYVDNIKDTVRAFCEEGFDTSIASTITTDNCNMENMLSIFEFLRELNGITSWGLRPAFPSIYKNNSAVFTPTGKQMYELFDRCERLKPLVRFPISFDKTFLERGYNEAQGGSEHFKGAECSANRSHIFILPDGKVTLCEQLYWKPHFIIGDLTKQTINEVWHSERAMWFANLETKHLQDGNPCKNCEIFDRCYKNMNRCWAEVMKAYGDEGWDFPDPRCMFAPTHTVNNLIY